VAPVGLFIHESAENLVFREQGNWNYDFAHGAAIAREIQIHNDLHIAGGFAGGALTTTIPK
jgi:hypothetical protein